VTFGQGETPGTAVATLTPYTRRRAARAAQARSRRPNGPDRDPPNRPAGAVALPIPVLPPPASAVAEPRTLYDPSPVRLPRRIGRLDDTFFSVDLPELNASASRGAISAAEFVAAISERLTPADLDGLVRIAPRMSHEELAYALGGLGIVVASAVKAERAESGDRQSMKALHAFPGMERTLLALAQISGRVPRDDHDTTWGKVTPPPWSFTGSDGERRFGEAVRRSEQDLGKAESSIDPLRCGLMSLEESVEALDEAAHWVDAYVPVQGDLAKRPFFHEFVAMRQFLQPQTIGGILYAPPNATNALRWTSLDHGVGLMEAYFADIAAKRGRLMPPLDRAQMQRSLALPTVCDRVAEAIGADPGHLAALSPDELQSRVLACRPGVRRGVMAAARLAKQMARLATVHLAVIQKNLVDPSAVQTAEEKQAQAVKPNVGVSGRGLEHTYDLCERRKQHPLVRLRIVKEDSK
jgi:hypothetical protein